MKIELLDLAAQYRSIKAEVDDAIGAVLLSGAFIQGPCVAEFESAVASYLGVRHGVGVANGTDALVLALDALGIGEGDEVIVPAYTFFATAEAVSRVGAMPVFVDISLKTYCVEPLLIEGAITPRTKAIIPVHLYGHPAPMEEILAVAERRGLKVIEDNAQAMGARYRGRRTGSLGDVACLSFFPSKNLGGVGDGGMVVTNDEAIADVVRRLRTHGWRKKYFPERIGYNSRLDTLQAAVLKVKLRHLDRWVEERRRIAAVYHERLSGAGALLPETSEGARHGYHLFVIRVENREAVQAGLKDSGIGTGVYYPQPLHRTAPYASRWEKARFPGAEAASRETLAIPLYPEMTEEQVSAVVAGVRHALGASSDYGIIAEGIQAAR